MDENTIALVQNSFAKVEPIAPAAAAFFYDDLFASAPQVKPLFKGDIDAQGMKLMTTLGVVVKGLNDVEKILPVAAELAKRHVDFGVKPADYNAVGASLIRTLEKGLGEAFTPEVQAAWQAAYEALSGVMIDSAYTAEASG